MTEKAPGLEIIKLWPSVFLEADLPGCEAPTQRLIALAESRPGDGVFAIDDAGVRWLKSHIALAVDAHLRETGYLQTPQWGARGRFEVQSFGDYSPLANQPGADLVGMYVMRWPSQQSTDGWRDDGLPGFVSFYDSRAGMNMNAIKRDPYHRYHQSLQPRAGLLIMWPAYVRYFVHPNRSHEPAMRVAFDVQLRGRSRSA